MTRSSAQKMVASAESAHKRALDALTTAREQLAHAKDQHDDRHSATTRSTLIAAQVDCESAERLAKRTDDAREQARVALARIEHADGEARYAAIKEELAAWSKDLEAKTAAVVEVDRSLDVAVMALARTVDAAVRKYQEAEELALALRLTDDFDRSVAKPSLANARLACQRAVAEARGTEDREDLSGFVAALDDRWQVADLPASARADVANRRARIARDNDFDDGYAIAKEAANAVR